MDINFIFDKRRVLIYFNYSCAFFLALIFFVYAKNLNLLNIDKYILTISISSIFASLIYSTSIKSTYENGKITIGITNNSIAFIFILIFISSIYLATRSNYLYLFLLLNIIFEVCFNLTLIYFIKKNETLKHSLILLLNSSSKILFLYFLASYLNNLLLIMSFYYILFFTLFVFIFKKLNIFFSSEKRLFKVYDIFYVLAGTLLFQFDKILGESFLNNNEYFLYFIIFKLSSVFQILGSIIFQPARNKLLSKEYVSNEIKRELNFFIKLMFVLLILLNISYFILITLNIKIDIIVAYLTINNLIIFNFFSIAFILHILNGFFIDSLFIKDFGKNLFFINIILLSFQIILMIIFKNIILWSSFILVSQILLTLFSIINYKKYVRNI